MSYSLRYESPWLEACCWMPSHLRLFIAIDPPRETAVEAGRIIERLRRSGTEAAWVDPARMHLTLHFLGNNVDESELHGICVAMDDACRHLPPFEVAFGGVGVFPDPRNPRVVWLGVCEGQEPLGQLHAGLGERLAPLGFEPEARGYRPHLTLGRLRRGRPGDPPASQALVAEVLALAEVAAGRMRATKVALYSSRHERQGIEYDRLHAASLRGGMEAG
jgi:2'-5' RNA ligase